MSTRSRWQSALLLHHRVVYRTSALLRDIGKIWCYGEEGFRPFQNLGHELAGLAALNGAFAKLQDQWTDGTIALRSLLAGVWKVKGGRPILAVGKIVQAFDQDSAEQELRRRKGHRHNPWTAKPCTNNAQDFRLAWEALDRASPRAPQMTSSGDTLELAKTPSATPTVR